MLMLNVKLNNLKFFKKTESTMFKKNRFYLLVLSIPKTYSLFFSLILSLIFISFTDIKFLVFFIPSFISSAIILSIISCCLVGSLDPFKKDVLLKTRKKTEKEKSKETNNDMEKKAIDHGKDLWKDGCEFIRISLSLKDNPSLSINFTSDQKITYDDLKCSFRFKIKLKEAFIPDFLYELYNELNFEGSEYDLKQLIELSFDNTVKKNKKTVSCILRNLNISSLKTEERREEQRKLMKLLTEYNSLSKMISKIEVIRYEIENLPVSIKLK